MVTQLTGMMVQRNKAIVGANAFAHEAGIHQDGMLKHRNTYEIMNPEDIGIAGTELVMGKHSGRHALKEHLTRMGFKLEPADLERAYDKFIALADKKKTIYDDDLVAIVQELMREHPLINCAMVSSLSPEDFHELTEGLGLFMQLPLHPGAEEAKKVIQFLDSISALMAT